MSVFAFLPLDERIRLREVCSSWKHALDDNRNWRAIDFAVMGPVGGKAVPPMLRWALERHGGDMHDLSTRGCHVNDDTLQIVGANCPNLEVLIVDEPPPDRDDDPSSILALSAPPAITQVGLAALAGCHQLTRLDASRSSASPLALQTLARALPFLAYVKLGGPSFTDAHTAALVPSGRDMLALDLSGSPVTDVALRTVALHCPRLRMLNCEGSAGITDAGLSALVFGCRELRILLVSGCRQLSDTSLSDVAHTCSQLHRLDAGRLPRITNAAVEALSEHCEALESITLLGCPKITADGLAVIVSDCVQLRQLAVDGVGLHSVVEELAPQGLGLTALTIRRCGGLTDTAAAALASSCPAVTSLDLSGSPLVGFTHLAAGALVHRLRSLHSLSLAECGVTDQSLALFPIARPRIASLDLSRNPGLTDAGIELALRACAPTLTSLSVAACDIGPDAAELLAHSGAPLTRLDMRMCPRINDAAVAVVLGAVGATLESLLLGVDAPTIHAASSADIIPQVLPDESPYTVVLEMSLPPASASASISIESRGGSSAGNNIVTVDR
jgi:F-box/leucine-rich repeat protein 2/20